MNDKKKEVMEKEFVNHILNVGVKKVWATDGEDKQRNNTYYQIELANGNFRHWTNLSEESLLRIEIASGFKIPR